MGGLKEGSSRIVAIASALAVTAAMAWGVAIQQFRRPAAADPARMSLRDRERRAIERAIQRAETEGDSESLAFFQQMQRDADRNAEHLYKVAE